MQKMRNKYKKSSSETKQFQRKLYTFNELVVKSLRLTKISQLQAIVFQKYPRKFE